MNLLLLDKAAQTLKPDVYIALQWEPRVVILTVDHKQLGPTVFSLQSGHNSLVRQLAKLMFTPLFNAGYEVPGISQWPNEENYDGQLLNAPNTLG